MTVKDLKQLLTDADDSLEVMVYTGEAFDFVNTELSGVSLFGEPCDEHGNPVEETLSEKELTFFVLIPKSTEHELQETAA
jgi:hypothetical protein